MVRQRNECRKSARYWRGREMRVGAGRGIDGPHGAALHFPPIAAARTAAE